MRVSNRVVKRVQLAIYLGSNDNLLVKHTAELKVSSVEVYQMPTLRCRSKFGGSLGGRLTARDLEDRVARITWSFHLTSLPWAAEAFPRIFE